MQTQRPAEREEWRETDRQTDCDRLVFPLGFANAVFVYNHSYLNILLLHVLVQQNLWNVGEKSRSLNDP